jgi:hypothetical protein
VTEEQLTAMERRWLPDDVPPLIAEVRRLQWLIKQAEWAAGYGDPYDHSPNGACPWCDATQTYIGRDGLSRPIVCTDGQHTSECPAFPPV